MKGEIKVIMKMLNPNKDENEQPEEKLYLEKDLKKTMNGILKN